MGLNIKEAQRERRAPRVRWDWELVSPAQYKYNCINILLKKVGFSGLSICVLSLE